MKSNRHSVRNNKKHDDEDDNKVDKVQKTFRPTMKSKFSTGDEL